MAKDWAKVFVGAAKAKNYPKIGAMLAVGAAAGFLLDVAFRLFCLVAAAVAIFFFDVEPAVAIIAGFIGVFYTILYYYLIDFFVGLLTLFRRERSLRELWRSTPPDDERQAEDRVR